MKTTKSDLKKHLDLVVKVLAAETLSAKEIIARVLKTQSVHRGTIRKWLMLALEAGLIDRIKAKGGRKGVRLNLLIHLDNTPKSILTPFLHSADPRPCSQSLVRMYLALGVHDVDDCQMASVKARNADEIHDLCRKGSASG